MKKQTTAPAQPLGIARSKDFWLIVNEGTEDETIMTLGQYIVGIENESDNDDMNVYLKIGKLNFGESVNIAWDFIRRIEQPKNTTFNPEAMEGLYNALQKIAECDGEKLDGKDAAGFVKIAKSALKSAKL